MEKLGHNVTIATYHIGKDISDKIETKIDVRRIRRLLFWYKKIEAGPDWQKVVLDLLLIRKVFNLARTQRPDIIHGHLHEGALIGWIVQKALFWRKIKLVADFHGSLAKEMESHQYLSSRWNKKLFRLIEKFIDRLGDAAVASSPENAAEISAISGRPVEVLLDGVNLKYYTAEKKKSELRRELELPEKSVIVTYLGALIANKGIGYLFDAFHRILEHYPNVFILLGGSPSEEGERFLRKNQFSGRIRFIYPLDYFEVPGLLSACDIGVDPKDSDTKQASGKILQYMGAGLAIACFGRESNRGYLDGNAAYAEEVTGEKLSEAIGKLVSDDSLRIRCGEGNRNQAKEFNWNRAGKQLEKLYEKIL